MLASGRDRLIESETLSPPGRLEQGHFGFKVTEIAALDSRPM
jgi:hypothetical protein